MVPRLRFGLVYGLTALMILFMASWAVAGGGPENVCLVVNPNSPISMAIANHYGQLRNIPPDNVVYIPFDPKAQRVPVDQFRDEILRPLLKTLEQRGLAPQIDYIVYSSGFPTGINLTSDLDRLFKKSKNPEELKSKWPQVLSPWGSINSLTFFYGRVLKDPPSYMMLTGNRYMRPVVADRQIAPTMGFRGAYQFDKKGELVSSGGERYLLSTMLAVIPDEKTRGISPQKAIAYLNRSVKADGTNPKGTIYFTQTSDRRTKAREADLPAARAALTELGVANELVNTHAPVGKTDVLGLIAGYPVMDWGKRRNMILPGAICDNFTSYGGIMVLPIEQTPLTEFLEFGAAGSSGTVNEPLATPLKFASPMIHAHYARGCSLAEAYYQSVHGPYQLLIMGDALCQPFARIPEVRVVQVKPGQQVSGELVLRPEASIPPKTPPKDPNAKATLDAKLAAPQATDNDEQVEHFELFVDGTRKAFARPGQPLSFDTTKLGDGYHELRVVAVGPAPIHTQGRKIIWIVTANHDHATTAEASSKKVALNGSVTVTAKSPGARRIEIRHNGRVLGTINGASGKATIKASKLGRGFNYLRVVGIHGNRPEDESYARPIMLWVS